MIKSLNLSSLTQKTLEEITKKCEPNDDWSVEMSEFDTFWILSHRNNIIGYLHTTDVDKFSKDENFEIMGGLPQKKGLQISGLCNGFPEKFTNVGSLLLQEITKYAKQNGYNYIVLHAAEDRRHLYEDDPSERLGLYPKNGFVRQRILSQNDGRFDHDVWIMYNGAYYFSSIIFDKRDT